MTSSTPVYGLPYPVASDLVKDAPQAFEAMVSGVESALQEIDDRATPAGSTPRLATTLSALDAQSGVTGQLGIVTGSGIDHGAYRYRPDDTDDRWGPVSLEGVPGRVRLASQYWTVDNLSALLIDHRLLALNAHLTRKGVAWAAGSVAWNSSSLFTLDGMSVPAEYHVPTISSASAPQSIVMQCIGSQINLRKPISADTIGVGGWLSISALIPVEID